MIKRLTSKELEKKKQQKRQRILGVVLIIVMFGSVFGVIVGSFNSSSSEESNYTSSYNGLDFVYNGEYFTLSLGQKVFYFSQAPSSFSNVEYEENLTKTLASIAASPLYIDSIDYTVAAELAQNLQGYPERIQMACLENSTCTDPSLPIKTCEENVISVQISSTNKIYEQDNCIFIEGNQQDLLTLTDITILKLLGVN